MIKTEIKYDDLIGVPFLHKGRDKKVGLDCLGLILIVYRREGIAIDDPCSDYDEDWCKSPEKGNPILENYHANWRKLRVCERPEVLDAVLFGSEVDYPIHIGIVVGEDRVLHCAKNYGVVMSRVSRLGKIIHGYYRLKELDKKDD